MRIARLSSGLFSLAGVADRGFTERGLGVRDWQFWDWGRRLGARSKRLVTRLPTMFLIIELVSEKTYEPCKKSNR
jgi:hypothetical protein